MFLTLYKNQKTQAVERITACGIVFADLYFMKFYKGRISLLRFSMPYTHSTKTVRRRTLTEHGFESFLKERIKV
jgi:hypothetical protein